MATDKSPLPLPFWQGEPAPPGGKMLLLTEQGVGEILALTSLIPELLARGITPVMEVEPRLVPLFRRSFAGIEVLTRETPANPRLFEADLVVQANLFDLRSEEHTSELQSLMRISYAIFCLHKKNTQQQKNKR